MKTKIVYVVVSTSDDFYLEQTLISAFSARFHNPTAHICIAIDQDSYAGLIGKRAEIKKYVTEFIIVDTPKDFNNMKKSRYIKTRLRSLVSGDFLYIDGDTVIAESLAEIDTCLYDLGAVADSNGTLTIGNTNYISDVYINKNIEKLGWPSAYGYPNYNGGVMYAKDTKLAHGFYDRWHELWLESIRNNVNIDMVALCRANIELGCCIRELSGEWNCQIQRMGLPLLSKAKIIHCFTGGNVSYYELCSNHVLDNIKSKGYLDEGVVRLIKKAKTAFLFKTMFKEANTLSLFKQSLYRLGYIYPSIFGVINMIASSYRKIKYS